MHLIRLIDTSMLGPLCTLIAVHGRLIIWLCVRSLTCPSLDPKENNSERLNKQ